MAEPVVRCPYCIVGDGFKPMATNATGRFICTKCGHLTIPDVQDFKCFCWHCAQLRAFERRRWDKAAIRTEEKTVPFRGLA
jgi:hypothetical protein